MSKVEHVVSVSGGKDSTALYLLALERMQAKGRPFRAVFADTGHEHEWTYEFVRRLPEITGGPAIQWVKADFAAELEKKRKWVAVNWPKRGVAPEVVEAAMAAMVPTGNPFLDLCIWKTRFPSSQIRFCTEELKVAPMFAAVQQPILEAGGVVVAWQGVRADESLARSFLPRWQRLEVPHKLRGKREFLERTAGARMYAFRPLLSWTVEDVWRMHEKHGIARNALYDNGMGRVGCMPCIMARKDEVRSIAARFPEHIDRIEAWERIVTEASKKGAATFFSISDDPTIDVDDPASWDIAKSGIRSRVEWSKTSRGGKQYDLDLAADFGTACNQWGACE